MHPAGLGAGDDRRDEGKSYQNASGIAITAIGIGTGHRAGSVAVGLAGPAGGARTPALLTQLFTGIVGIYLVQGRAFAWGVPPLVLAVAGFVLAAGAASLRA